MCNAQEYRKDIWRAGAGQYHVPAASDSRAPPEAAWSPRLSPVTVAAAAPMLLEVGGARRGIYRSRALPDDDGGALEDERGGPRADVLYVSRPPPAPPAASYESRYFRGGGGGGGPPSRAVAPAFSAHTGAQDMRARRADLLRKSALLMDLGAGARGGGAAAGGAPEAHAHLAVQRRLAAYEALEARREALRVLLAREGARSARAGQNYRQRSRWW